jgi:hypothetical protein
MGGTRTTAIDKVPSPGLPATLSHPMGEGMGEGYFGSLRSSSQSRASRIRNVALAGA